MNSAAELIRETGIIAILRGDFPLPHVEAIAEAIAAGGVRVIEITLNSSNALEAIGRMQGLGSNLLVGAGTIRTPEQASEAIAAGAQFIVSPNFDPASVERSHDAGILHLPGVYTASEAQAAFAAGCRMVKLFPSDIGGPAYLRALRAPLDDIEFIAVGGINAENMGDYIRAGAVAVGAGSALVRGKDDDPAELTARARKLSEAFLAARRSGAPR